MQDKRKNYELFKNTIQSLSYSQGSYGRLLVDILEVEKDKQEFQNLINRLPDFKDSLDVIMFIEC